MKPTSGLVAAMTVLAASIFLLDRTIRLFSGSVATGKVFTQDQIDREIESWKNDGRDSR